MTEIQKIKVNLQIQVSTDEKLEALAAKTFRKKGDVIDWLVNEKYDELTGNTATPSPQPLLEQAA